MKAIPTLMFGLVLGVALASNGVYWHDWLFYAIGIPACLVFSLARKLTEAN